VKRAAEKRCEVYGRCSGYQEYVLKCAVMGIGLPRIRLADPVYRHDMAKRSGFDVMSMWCVMPICLVSFMTAFVLMSLFCAGFGLLAVVGYALACKVSRRVLADEYAVCEILGSEFPGQRFA